MTDSTPRPSLLVQALAAIKPEAWRSTTHNPTPAEDTMDAQHHQPNDAHNQWLATALLIEDDPPPSPVIFFSDPKAEQVELVRIIGDRLRQARELCNLSQGAAAKRLGYSNSSKLSKVEGATDTNSVPLWLILRAAKVYEVSVDFLFGVTDDWETGVLRGVQGWMFDAWEKARQRDLAALAHLHAEIVAVGWHITVLTTGAREVAAALDLLRARNPKFDDMPASGTLAGRLERLQASARDADVALRRFRLGAGDKSLPPEPHPKGV